MAQRVRVRSQSKGRNGAKNRASKKRAGLADKPPLDWAVYDGRERIGSIREVGKSSYQAANLAGKVTGHFPTLKAASASLSGGGAK